MNIGQAAKHSGLSAKMIRYYEQIGLLPEPERTNAGYRIYDDQDVQRLGFIQQARLLGFSSEQMKDLLALWQNKNRQSRNVKKLAESHIEWLQAKIAEMQRMVKILQHSVDQCAGNEQAECHILNHIEQGNE